MSKSTASKKNRRERRKGKRANAPSSGTLTAMDYRELLALKQRAEWSGAIDPTSPADRKIARAAIASGVRQENGDVVVSIPRELVSPPGRNSVVLPNSVCVIYDVTTDAGPHASLSYPGKRLSRKVVMEILKVLGFSSGASVVENSGSGVWHAFDSGRKTEEPVFEPVEIDTSDPDGAAEDLLAVLPFLCPAGQQLGRDMLQFGRDLEWVPDSGSRSRWERELASVAQAKGGIMQPDWGAPPASERDVCQRLLIAAYVNHLGACETCQSVMDAAQAGATA